MVPTASQIEQFRRDGYFTTEVLFDERTLHGVQDEFDRLWQENIAEVQKTGDAKAAELARLRPFIGEVHKHSDICRRLCFLPVFQELSRQLIGPDADLFYNQAVCKPPGKGRSFAWHQDNQYGLTDPLAYITCWVAISRATVDNGTIWLVPGMHKQGMLPHIWGEEAREWQCQLDTSYKQPVVLRAGQMAVFSSLLPHSSGPNTSGETRYAYVVQYHHGGVKKKGTHEPYGDQVPLLRGGRAVV